MTKQERIDFILRQVMNIDGQRVALNETKEYIERQLRELNKERTLYSEQLQIINEKDLVPNGPV